MLKMPKVMFGCLTFIGSCAIEYTCGIWGSTFLVNSLNLPAETAALCVTFYYAGIAFGRFFSGVLSIRLSAEKITKIGQTITLAAVSRFPAGECFPVRRSTVFNRAWKRSCFPESYSHDTDKFRKRYFTICNRYTNVRFICRHNASSCTVRYNSTDNRYFFLSDIPCFNVFRYDYRQYSIKQKEQFIKIKQK